MPASASRAFSGSFPGGARSFRCPGPLPAQAHSRREPEGKTRLQNEQDEEVGIGDSLELLEEVERQEGEQVVLGGFNGVFLWTEDDREKGGSRAAQLIPPPR